MTREQILTRLERIASQPGFVYMLAILVHHELFVDPADLADTDWRKKLSIQELTLLAGLMVKHAVHLDPPDEKETATALSEVKQLFEDLHRTYNEPLMATIKEALEEPIGPIADAESDQQVDAFFASGEAMAEPIFYGDSGAYDFQLTAFARTRYAHDADWLRANRGFTLADVSELPALLKRIGEQRARKQERPASFGEFCQDTLESFTFSRADLGVSDGVASAFLNAFSMDPGQANANFVSVGQYNVIESHPIIRLGKDLFFLPIHFLLAQSLYESPFYWMLRDRVYSATAAKNRGTTTEDIAYEILRPVFGAGMFKNIIVKRGKRETVTDIDLLAVVGNNAIVLQAKSKRLTELSRQGDTDRLKEDFARAVQDAYDQGLACRDAILARRGTLLDRDGTVLKLSESIDDVYVICLTSDHYPALTTQVDTYLQRQPDAPAPVAMSIFDLEIVAFYLHERFDFLYYIRQRVSLSGIVTAALEMAFLGFHLRKKLFHAKGYHYLFADEQFAQLIDASYPALMGHHPMTEATERLRPIWKNEKFDRLVREVQAASEPRFTDAVFYLYDLSSDTADGLIQHIENALERSRKSGVNSDFSLISNGGKSGVSFIAHTGGNETLADTVMAHGRARKYKSKADTWLALGSMVDSHRMVDMIAFTNESWRYDAQMERFVQIALKAGIAVGVNGKKIGRNARCVCGSGMKFKKCCGRDG